MRNLAEYPITKEEVVEALKDAKANLNPELIGDLRPVIYQDLIDMIDLVWVGIHGLRDFKE